MIKRPTPLMHERRSPVAYSQPNLLGRNVVGALEAR